MHSCAATTMAWRGHTINMREWTTQVHSQRGSSHTIFHLAIHGHAPGFSVTADFSREGMLAKLRKLFQREIQVGDPIFDDFVYISTRQREDTEALLRRSGAQSTLMDLLCRFDRVSFNNGTFELYKQDTNPIAFGDEGALAVCALLAHIEHRHDPDSGPLTA